MAVRVTKPAFNLRSKLTELNVPVGNHGSQLMKSNDAAESFDLVRAGRKNLIFNGAMQINQRNGGSSVTVDGVGTYNLDRWCVHEATGGSVSCNMDGDPPNYPKSGVGQFQKAMQIACAGADTSITSSENVHFFQNIEGYTCAHLEWGTDNAKPVTLSFWVKTNKEGIYSVGLENNGADRNCIREYFHDGTHQWQKFSMTYPGCTDGTWVKDKGLGIRVRFCLASADQYGDGKDGVWVNSDELHAGRQTNFMDSTNNRFFITGVQLEEGTVATSFEHLSYGEDLVLCQRYFQEQQGNSDAFMCAAKGQGSSSADIGVPLSVPLRASPTITCSNHRVFTSDGVGFSNSSTAPTVLGWDDHHSVHSCIIAMNAAGHSGLNNNECLTWAPLSSGLLFNAEL